jgi:hypothetical protein
VCIKNYLLVNNFSKKRIKYGIVLLLENKSVYSTWTKGAFQPSGTKDTVAGCQIPKTDQLLGPLLHWFLTPELNLIVKDNSTIIIKNNTGKS